MRKNKITAVLLVLLMVLIAGMAVACNDEKEENPEITPISLTLGADWKNVYAVGEAFAPCQMTVTYSDGSTQTVDVTADMLSGFDTSSAGAKQITVNYSGLTATVGISVVAPAAAEKLSLDSWKALYFVGDAINLSNAALVIDGSDKAAVTADMVSGFDTSSAGLKTVRITYNYSYIDADIVVVNRPQGVAAGEKSQIDHDEFVSALERLLTAMGLEDAMENICEVGFDYDIMSFFEAAGVTTEEFKGMIDTAMSNDSALPNAVKQIMNILFEGEFESTGAMINAIADEVLKEEVLGALADTFGYAEGVIEPEDLVNLVLHLLKGMMTHVSWQGTVSIYFSPIGFDSTYNVTDSYAEIDESAIEEAFENAGLKDYYDDYYFGSDSDYGKFFARLMNTDDAKVIAASVLRLFDTISTYGVGTTADLLDFAVEVIVSVMDGIESGEGMDLNAIFAGEKFSYKDIVGSLNLLGEIGSEVNRVLAADPEFVLSATKFVNAILKEDYDLVDFEVDKISTGILALDRMVFELLQNVTPELMSEIYLDYDDWAKEEDEVLSKQKFGYLCVKIINFVVEEYDLLSEDEKDAIYYSVETVLPETEIAVGAEAFLDILNGWTIKDADAYTAEELSAVADRVNAAVDGTSFGENEVDYTYVVSVSFNDNIVEKGTPEEEIPVTVFMMHMYGNGGSSEVGYSSLAEFAAADGEYELTADFSQKGFTEVTLTVKDFIYNGNTYHGAAETTTFYVYDSTSSADFRQYRNSSRLVGVVIPRGADVTSGVSLYQLNDLPWRFVHIDTGIEVNGMPNLFADGALTGEFVGVDTSLPVGLYAAKFRYAHNVFGEVEIPLLYYICDPQSESQPVTGVDTYYINEEALSSYSTIKLPKGLEYNFYAELNYSYVVKSEKTEVICEGFDPSAEGVQIVTLYPAGYPEFAETFSIELVEIGSVSSVNCIFGTNMALQVPVNGNENDIYMYESVFNPDYAQTKPFKTTIYFYYTNEDGDEISRSYTVAASSFGEYVDIMGSLGITVSVSGLDSSVAGTYETLTVKHSFNGTEYASSYTYYVTGA